MDVDKLSVVQKKSSNKKNRVEGNSNITLTRPTKVDKKKRKEKQKVFNEYLKLQNLQTENFPGSKLEKT